VEKVTSVFTDPAAMLGVALAEARAGYAEGGVPLGAALFGPDGGLLGRGRNRRVQDDDPSVEHGVEVIVLDDPECLELMTTFIKERPDLWNEDIGVGE